MSTSKKARILNIERNCKLDVIGAFRSFFENCLKKLHGKNLRKIEKKRKNLTQRFSTKSIFIGNL